MSRSSNESNKRKKTYEIDEKLKYTDHMSAIIKKAEKDGHFDDLPGKGKPLDFGRTYLNPSEAQLYKTLKDNHVLPPWIELSKEIESLKEELSQVIDPKDKRIHIKIIT